MRHVLRRPTSKVSEHARGFPKEWNIGRHFDAWIGLSGVCVQVQVRLWRFSCDCTYWRSYEP